VVEILINGVITADEFKQDHTDQGYDVYSFNDLVRDLGDETEATITINSIGGMVEEGFKMYDLINKINATTIAISASSIASVVFLAGKKRYVKNGAEMIIHNGWASPSDLEDMVINVHSIDELKAEFEKVDSQIIKVYTDKTKLTETKALALMAVDTNIGSQAIELGFAHEYYNEDSEPIKAHSYKNKYLMFNQKSITMANEATEKRLTGIEKVLNGILNVFKAKNMLVSLQDGTEIFVYSEDGEFEGKKAVIAMDGNPTGQLAPAGTHVLNDGREIVVGEGGVIESVKEAVSTEDMAAQITAMEEEKTELEKAKAEIESKYNALVTDSEKAKIDMQKQFNELATQIKALKKEVMGGDPDHKEKPVFKAMDQAEFAKLPYSERIKLQFKNSK
jgi:ATP-dependent Clp protease, protease subunit